VITLGFNRTEKVRSRRRQSQVDVVLRLCERIARFMQENEGGEFKAFFSRDRGIVGLYLVTTAETYDFALGDKLTEFAAPYIERGLLGCVTLLPASSPDELSAYFDPKKALRVEIDHA
jgi:hypothetical protein